MQKRMREPEKAWVTASNSWLKAIVMVLCVNFEDDRVKRSEGQ